MDFAGDPAAAGVLTALTKGKWRQARDSAKELCKKDRARYLPLLVEANIRLVHDLASRGLLSDARPVIDYLRTLCPPETINALLQEIAKSPAEKPAESAMRAPQAVCATLWPDLCRIAGELQEGRAATPGDLRIIDEIVTSFASVNPSAGNPVAERLAAELTLVQTACKAAAEGRWEEMADTLRPLRSDSLFRHWRLFLRGMRHVFCGEKAMAKECLKRIPPGGACAQAALVLAGGSGRIPVTARASWILATCGQDPAKGFAIAAAEQSWKTGNWNAARESLFKAFGKNMPCSNDPLERTLADALFHNPPPVSEVSDKRSTQYFSHYRRLCTAEKCELASIQAMIRNLSLHSQDETDTRGFAEEWVQFLWMQTLMHGSNPLRDSQGHLWLGNILSIECVKDPSDRGSAARKTLRDGDTALQAFQKACELDPDNVDAWLGRLRVLEKTARTSERNELLDELVNRFPRNKNILAQAGRLAIQRNALVKGIQYLESARALDPLDPECTSDLLRGLLQRTVQMANRKKATPDVWGRMEPLLDASPDCRSLLTSRWVMRLRRSLLDSSAAGAAARKDAIATGPAPGLVLFVEKFLSLAHQAPLPSCWAEEWSAAEFATCGILNELLGLFDNVTLEDGFHIDWFLDFDVLLRSAFQRNSFGLLAAADPAGAFNIAGNLWVWHRKRSLPLRKAEDAVRPLIHKTFLRDVPPEAVKSSVHLSFCHYALMPSWQLVARSSANRNLDALEEIMNDANRLGEIEVAVKTNSLIREITFLTSGMPRRRAKPKSAQGPKPEMQIDLPFE